MKKRPIVIALLVLAILVIESFVFFLTRVSLIDLLHGNVIIATVSSACYVLVDLLFFYRKAKPKEGGLINNILGVILAVGVIDSALIWWGATLLLGAKGYTGELLPLVLAVVIFVTRLFFIGAADVVGNPIFGPDNNY